MAITAIVGIFYGSTAFSNYQLKARANQWINFVNQIATAGAMWRANYSATSVCDAVGSSYPLNVSGLCAHDAIHDSWATGKADAGKYVWPFTLINADFPDDGTGRHFDTFGAGPIVFDGITYHGGATFYNLHDGKGDFFLVMIYIGSYLGAGDSALLDPASTMVKLCQKINENRVPANLTLDPTYNVPITTAMTDVNFAGSGYGATAEIPQGLCFLNKVSSGFPLMEYYIQF